MPKSIFAQNYRLFCELLIQIRKTKGITQAELAKKLKKPQSYVSKIEKRERRMDVVEFTEIALALGENPGVLISKLQNPSEGELWENKTILDKWNVGIDDLTELVNANPSLGGMIIGYMAEQQLKKILQKNSEISKISKFDDHDRKNKGDLFVTYKKREFRIEVKSLQTNMIKKEGGVWLGKAQCDASDRREIKLPSGNIINTTCLLVGEFDILAVCIFGFEQKWEFLFADNFDLPRSTYKQYSTEDQQYLLKSLVPVSKPVAPPFSESIIEVMDAMIRKAKRR